VQVTDTGPGIAPELRDRIFTPFERLGAENSEVQGTGLGLALSLQLVEAMGGTIVLQSAVGRGSSFFVTLPIVARPSAQFEAGREAGGQGVAQRPSSTSTVLYVEDNLANLEVMELVLDYRPGVRLISAMQGRLGFDLAKQHHPDLVLLDLNLADISGREVLARLQGDPLTADIPVVILSAETPQGGVESLLHAGARAYVTKPFDMQELLDLLEEILGESPV
jgi:CheY-like chemotaxis protein